MACGIDAVWKDIVSNCSTALTAGIEVEACLIRRTDLVTPLYDITNKSIITGIACKLGKKAYKITGFRDNMFAGHDGVVSAEYPKRFSHVFAFKQYERAAEDIENVDNIDDFVVIVEMKDKTTTGDGTFRAYGVTKGLFITTDTARTNTDNATRSIEAASAENGLESFSHFTVFDTDTATTKAMIDALYVTAIV
ncbi:MAG: hypothetical protein OEL89_04965 [Candidatus Peregrinibacteria bacterium]|nr:hypothetical protein [Candidatus Peregrinibacteria bacterium]